MLLKLSTELLEMIAEHCINHLIDWSLLKLRSTCRDVQLRTRNFWRKTYFAERCLRLELDKLKQLCEICNDSELACTVTRLEIICADDYKVDLARDGKGAPSQLRKDLLFRAFSQLKNVRTLDFGEEAWDFPKSTSRRLAGDGDPIVDFSGTFATILEVAEECDLQLTAITHGAWICGPEPYFGIVDCGILARVPKCLSNVVDLELDLLYEADKDGSAYKSMTARKELALGIGHLKKLKRLHLSFPGSDEVVPQILSSIGSTLPCLESLALNGADCDFQSLRTFLRPHAGTLRSFELSNTMLDDSHHQIENFRHLLEELRNSFNLTELILRDVETLHYSLSFPGICGVHDTYDANEDGYVDMWAEPKTVELQGDGVMDGISHILSCLMWTFTAD